MAILRFSSLKVSSLPSLNTYYSCTICDKRIGGVCVQVHAFGPHTAACINDATERWKWLLMACTEVERTRLINVLWAYHFCAERSRFKQTRRRPTVAFEL